MESAMPPTARGGDEERHFQPCHDESGDAAETEADQNAQQSGPDTEERQRSCR